MTNIFVYCITSLFSVKSTNKKRQKIHVDKHPIPKGEKRLVPDIQFFTHSIMVINPEIIPIASIAFFIGISPLALSLFFQKRLFYTF